MQVVIATGRKVRLLVMEKKIRRFSIQSCRLALIFDSVDKDNVSRISFGRIAWLFGRSLFPIPLSMLLFLFYKLAFEMILFPFGPPLFLALRRWQTRSLSSSIIANNIKEKRPIDSFTFRLSVYSRWELSRRVMQSLKCLCFRRLAAIFNVWAVTSHVALGLFSRFYSTILLLLCVCASLNLFDVACE